MSSTVREKIRFLRSFVANPRQVGALVPTSARAVGDMLDMADVGSAKLVVELGAGTGTHTGEILRRLPADGTLIAFEIDHVLAAGLEARFPDSRLRVLAESAEKAQDYIDGFDSGERADLVVSAIPYTSLPAMVRARILDTAQNVLRADGQLLVLQYSPLLRSELRRRFATVRTRICVFNVPPAFLFACSSTAGPSTAGSSTTGSSTAEGSG